MVPATRRVRNDEKEIVAKFDRKKLQCLPLRCGDRQIVIISKILCVRTIMGGILVILLTILLIILFTILFCIGAQTNVISLSY